MELFRRGGSDFTRVGFWGQIVKPVGAGEVWSGEGTLASPRVGSRERGRRTTQGVPSPHIIHPRPDGKTWFHPPELDAYGVIPLVALLDIGQ